MADYTSVATEISRVRNAWRRSRAWHGTIRFGAELMTVFGLALLANWLFDLHVFTRMLLLGAVVAAAGALFMRHVVRPLRRKITDEQMALFIEEKNDHYEGAFLAAAEFGPHAGGLSAVQADIVREIVDAAVDRAKRFDLLGALRSVQWRRYGVALGALFMVYAVMAVFQPESMKRSLLKTVNPLYVPPATAALQQTGAVTRVYNPLAAVVGLSDLQMKLYHDGQPLADETAIKRGALFDLAVEFNRDPDESEKPVRVNFRQVSAQDKKRESIDFKPIDKMYSFGTAIPDVTEELELTVSAGKSETKAYRVRVYDPLQIEQVTTITRAPAYARWPERKESQPALGNVSALVGSDVTLVVRVNHDIKNGSLRWEAPAAPQAGTIDTASPRELKATFKVMSNTSFTLALKDAFGQEVEFMPPCVVTAKPDEPPTLEVLAPKMDVSATPIGDVRVVVRAKDDIALDRVEIVFSDPSVENAPLQRIACELKPASAIAALAGGKSPGAGNAVSQDAAELGAETPGGDAVSGYTDAAAIGAMEMEKLNDGKLKVGDTMVFYVEAFDRKGQSIVSDPYLLWVNPYETAGFWGFVPMKVKPGHPHYNQDTLLNLYAALWDLRREFKKGKLNVEEYRKACEEQANKLEAKIKYWRDHPPKAE